jgi:integrase
MLAREITSASLRSYQQQRLDQGAAKATVDRELELVGRAFRIAFADGKVASVPVATKLLRVHGNARKGFITPKEFGALLPHIKDADFRDWVLWFWWTGMRNGEISSLTWEGFEDGDPALITLFAENAKTGEPRKRPVVGPLLEIMNRRRARRLPDCPLVFHASGRSFKANHSGLPRWWYAEWKEACEAIGRPELRPYDLRRSAVRNLIRECPN